MSKPTTPEWDNKTVEAFMRAVYGDAAELVAACFNEKLVLEEATRLISELRAELAQLAPVRAAIGGAKTEAPETPSGECQFAIDDEWAILRAALALKEKP